MYGRNMRGWVNASSQLSRHDDAEDTSKSSAVRTVSPLSRSMHGGKEDKEPPSTAKECELQGTMMRKLRVRRQELMCLQVREFGGRLPRIMHAVDIRNVRVTSQSTSLFFLLANK